jgi:rare lipoprotein A
MQPIPNNIARFICALVPALILAGCGTSPISESSKESPHRAASPGASGNAAIPALPPAGSGRGGYYQDDGPGEKPPENLLATPNAEPKIEPYSTRSNRPYVVFGKTYRPIVDDRPFKQRGIGSWYGKKFHGQKTSSGELYDMYKMTAAHPTLPIPSYARVTNLANGQQVIVRINDRGPFHAGRIIDLSYTAALKLGYLTSGSSELEVERLLPDDIARMSKEKQENSNPIGRAEPPRLSSPMPIPASVTGVPAAASSASQAAVEAMLRNDANPLPASSAAAQSDVATAKPASITMSSVTPDNIATGAGNFYIQFGAYSQADRAESARAQLQQQWTNSLPPLEVSEDSALYRLLCGPFSTREEAATAAQKLPGNSAGKVMVVRR